MTQTLYLPSKEEKEMLDARCKEIAHCLRALNVVQSAYVLKRITDAFQEAHGVDSVELIEVKQG